IGFIHGNGDISVSTNSNLTLASDVISKNSKGQYGIKLTASKGSIEQTGGKIYADNIWMNATNGIGAGNAINQQMQSTNGVFSAITTNGDVNLLSLNKAGEKNSNLKLTANTDNGNVSVLADASLLNGAESVNAKGNRIDLTSNYGSIGTGNSLLKIQAGQSIVNPGDTLSASVNATALKDVALEQTSGDMRIGRIVSRTGDVYINSDGSLIDALPPSGISQTNESADNLIAKWKSLGIISEDGKDNSAEKKKEVIEGYKTNINTLFKRYNNLKEYYTSDEHKNETDGENYKEYNSLKEMFGSYTSADKWLEAQNKDKNSEFYRLQNEVTYGWTQDALLYAIQNSIINKESGSTTSEKDASDANIKGRNIFINAKGGIGSDEVPEVVDISNLQSKEGLDSLKKLAAAEASDVKWGYDGDNVDENKATINRVNGILIDASGYLQANAKGNVYLEDVNKNAIKITKVDSGDGNIRIYGKNGIYNVNANTDETILSGKDLILESGNGSIGSSTAPITTDMSGYVTARSNSDIWLYQNGANPLIISAMYAGGNISIRAMNSILSVYNGVQADELGYINANGDLTLLSDQGDIGEANGKGLRVKLAKDKVLNAEANSIYIKSFGEEGKINFGKFIARNGNIGLDAKLWDVFLKNNVSAKNIEFIVRSITQLAGSLTASDFLNITADNGILLDKENNSVRQASFINNKKGDILFYNHGDLTLKNVENKAEGGNIGILNEGSVTSENGINSNGNLLIYANSDIELQKDTKAREWLGIYAENGGIKARSLTGGSIDLMGELNGLTADNINSGNYINVEFTKGDITTGNLTATAGDLKLITKEG
ncbi:MAG: hypothetical protein II567_07100, partial [Candidatus Riflebacteria bacterium]|nr:hypothetical protein [Candidatus Riflebacteria bacterium]